MEKRTRFVVCAAIMAFLMILSLPGVFMAIRVNRGMAQDIQLYTEGWYLEESGEKVHLPYFTWEKAGNTVAFSHSLTDRDWGRWLQVLTMDELFCVYVDGDKIYERHTYSSPKTEKLPTNGYNYIQIPKGEKITFEMTTPYQGYGIRLNAVYIGDTEADLLYFNYATYQYSYFLDILLIVLGGLWVAYGIFQVCIREPGGMMIYLGLFTSCLGAWLQFGKANVDVRQVSGLLIKSAYWFWFLLPVFLCGFLEYFFTEKKKKYKTWKAVFILAAVLDLALAALGLFDLPELVAATNALLVVCGVGILLDLVREGGGAAKKSKLGSAGFLMFFILAVLEVLQYYFSNMPSGSVIRLGLVVCSMCVGVDELFRRQMEKIRLLQKETRMRKMQLEATLSQLQPQFIFKTLDFIQTEIPTNPDLAAELTGNFSRYLRGSLMALQNEGTAPFSQELEQVKAYLRIEQERYSHRLKVCYEIGVEDFEVPPLSLVGLAANAIQRSIRMGGGQGEVTVRTRRQGSIVTLEVADNGAGFDMNIYTPEQIDKGEEPEWTEFEVLKDSFMSLSNVCHRLKEALNASVQIESETGRGMTVRVEFITK